jgi:hypothetical protein
MRPIFHSAFVECIFVVDCRSLSNDRSQFHSLAVEIAHHIPLLDFHLSFETDIVNAHFHMASWNRDRELTFCQKRERKSMISIISNFDSVYQTRRMSGESINGRPTYYQSEVTNSLSSDTNVKAGQEQAFDRHNSLTLRSLSARKTNYQFTVILHLKSPWSRFCHELPYNCHKHRDGRDDCHDR